MTRHPAKYSKELVPALAQALIGAHRVLDPFAGTGRIHTLNGYTVPRFYSPKKHPDQSLPFATLDLEITAIELEPEWIVHHPVIIGDALQVMPTLATNYFDAICTSPTYGNRMADHHDAKDGSRRNTYKHTLGRELSAGNSGAMQWGDEYRTFHTAAWEECVRLLRPGGRFVLNIKDHIRKGEVIPVTQWHIDFLKSLGLIVVLHQRVNTPGNKQGANSTARIEYESVITFLKPPAGELFVTHFKNQDLKEYVA